MNLSNIDISFGDAMQAPASFDTQIAELRARHAAVAAGGGEAFVQRHRERGKIFRA